MTDLKVLKEIVDSTMEVYVNMDIEYNSLFDMSYEEIQLSPYATARNIARNKYHLALTSWMDAGGTYEYQKDNYEGIRVKRS
jgi:hypothetical protein